MEFAFLATMLSGLTGGKVPAAVITFILKLIPTVAELIQGIREIEAEGPEKAKAVVVIVADEIDDRLDDIPEWADLSEEQRDRMLYGLVEWVYWGLNLREKRGKRGSRKLLRTAFRKLKA